MKCTSFAGFLCVALLTLSACGGGNSIDVYNDPAVKDPMNPNRNLRPSEAGKYQDNRLNLFGTSEPAEKKINAYLWNATLSVLKEFPIDKVDPEARYVMTEWYSPVAGEQFKIYVQLIKHELTSQSIDVKVYKKTTRNGQTLESFNNPELETKIRNEILNRSRELRQQS